MQAQILDRAVHLSVLIAGQEDFDVPVSDTVIEERLAFFRKTVETLVADYQRIRGEAKNARGRKDAGYVWRRRLEELTR